MAYQTLNKLKWTNQLEKCKVVILHRGAPNNKKLVSGKQITEIKKTHFYYKAGERETHIPMHRVLEIKVGRKLLWKRKQ